MERCPKSARNWRSRRVSSFESPGRVCRNRTRLCDRYRCRHNRERAMTGDVRRPLDDDALAFIFFVSAHPIGVRLAD
jgi:hypothetical protein